MRGPPAPEMRRAASAKAAPEIAQSELQQQRTYTIPVNVQAFIAALLPFSFPFVCVLASCGGSR
jgi:hypothetical protein